MSVTLLSFLVDTGWEAHRELVRTRIHTWFSFCNGHSRVGLAVKAVRFLFRRRLDELGAFARPVRMEAEGPVTALSGGPRRIVDCRHLR